ncbi:MAG: CRTAC1 family protein [Planctomycetes bacterium]|nr:CRTAC1 family protein [Planctomycetota bacterium]MBT6452355.1 CRTAC1 family protein [Planctomycetota bacterium]MBT6540143.1 CRTAC1 family protein [Planctomycetota bacterium]MBT6968966.1 CRTAC1 family protein [Planctomycetota bacterium]MBT7131303.1 CRTAC1 family protein [Planctomycetota bacterium]
MSELPDEKSPEEEEALEQDPLLEQDDEIIGRAFRGSLLFLLIAALLLVLIWWVSRPDDQIEPISDVNQIPVQIRDTGGSAPPLPFTDITMEAGIDFIHDSGARGEKLLPETMGSGAAFCDIDQDGDADLILASGRPWPWTGEEPAASTIRLWLNDGTGSFEEATEQWQLDTDCYATGIAVGDIDGDRDLDLFIAAVGSNRLLINDGSTFRRSGVGSAIEGAEDSWSSSAGFFDADNDDDLDLFICEYVQWSRKKDIEVDYRLTGVGRAYGPPTNFAGTHCRLLINDGDGNFTDVSGDAGLTVEDSGMAVAKSLALLPVDVDQDGNVDVMVANDTTRNFMFKNLGNGTFEEVGEQMGLAYDGNGSTTGAMGLDVTDYRNDGSIGIVIANFSAEMTGLYRYWDQSNIFMDESINEGIGPPSRKALSFGILFLDVDLDGRQDLIQANGHLEEEISTVQPGQEYRQGAQLFWNRGDVGSGCFEEIPRQQTKDLGTPSVGRGLAFADIDGDGDVDLLMTQTGGPARLLRNDQSSGHHWIRIDPGDLPAGSWIECRQKNRSQRRVIGRTRSYLSQSERWITFGLGSDDSAPEIIVHTSAGETISQIAPGVDRRIEAPGRR